MYAAHVGHMVRLLGDHTPLVLLAAEEWDGYFSARHAEGVSPETRWKERCTARGALKLAKRWGSYPHDLETTLPEIDHPYTPGKRHHTLQQVRRLLKHLPERRAVVVCFLVAFGADWHSVELAEPGDIRASDATIRGTKTSHRHRTIPIRPEFAAFAKRAAAGLPFEPWTNVQRDLTAACKRAKVPRVTPRDFRRTHGRVLRADGVAPHLIGKMLGHADSTMAERVYAPLEPQELARLMRAGTPKVHRSPKKPKSAA